VERIAVFAALRWECRPVLRQLHQTTRTRVADFAAWRGVAAGHQVWVVKTGMGMAHAAAAARAVSDTSEFGLFVSTGCAGALASDMQPGDVHVASAVVRNPTGERLETDGAQREHAYRVATDAALRTSIGTVLCSPHALATAAEKHAAAAAHGAFAVEMEGAAIAAQAAQVGVPFISVRTILDTAETELRYAGRFVDSQTGAVKPLALAAYLATHPGAVADLLAMQQMMRAAQTSLERFFAAWFPTLNS